MKSIMMAIVALVAMSFGGVAFADEDLSRTIQGQKKRLPNSECVALEDGKNVEAGFDPCELIQYFGIKDSGTCEPLSKVSGNIGTHNVHTHCWTDPKPV